MYVTVQNLQNFAHPINYLVWKAPVSSLYLLITLWLKPKYTPTCLIWWHLHWIWKDLDCSNWIENDFIPQWTLWINKIDLHMEMIIITKGWIITKNTVYTYEYRPSFSRGSSLQINPGLQNSYDHSSIGLVQWFCHLNSGWIRVLTVLVHGVATSKRINSSPSHLHRNFLRLSSYIS